MTLHLVLFCYFKNSKEASCITKQVMTLLQLTLGTMTQLRNKINTIWGNSKLRSLIWLSSSSLTCLLHPKQLKITICIIITLHLKNLK
jgi:hypothetical protein